ncbi:MAG: glycine/sarcosine/betaine reductase selenoprotein B family protein [Deltaproteobacteria bacterium]|nr:glycine/sarcosine/betaine reductase selenoprotein B family protein [Deltaproteobacteria bacterium]
MGRLKNIILAKILTRFPSLLDKIVAKTGRTEVSGIPWAPLKKRLSESKVALVTTAGVHLKSQKPFDMRDPNGDPTYRDIPLSTPKNEYTITHDYYDHKDADRDLNIVFPIDRLKEMKEAGAIGSLAEVNYGFMGHIDGPHIETLIKKTAPEVAGKLKTDGVDVVLLTPG